MVGPVHQKIKLHSPDINMYKSLLICDLLLIPLIHARIINRKKYFGFIYKFKLKFVFIVYCITIFLASGVIAILLSAETVSVTLLCITQFYFEPRIF